MPRNSVCPRSFPRISCGGFFSPRFGVPRDLSGARSNEGDLRLILEGRRWGKKNGCEVVAEPSPHTKKVLDSQEDCCRVLDSCYGDPKTDVKR